MRMRSRLQVGNLTSDIPFWAPPENMTQAANPRPVYTINSATGRLPHGFVPCTSTAFYLPALPARLSQTRTPCCVQQRVQRQGPPMGRECLKQNLRGFSSDCWDENVLTGMFGLMCRHL